MEKVPFAFSLALCSFTRPVFLTEIMTMRFFLLDVAEFGGGGDWGYPPSSSTRMWVMYDSWTDECQYRLHLWRPTQDRYMVNIRCPCSSTLAKQLSVILRRSSSNRSARDIPEGVELEVEGGPLAPPVDGRLGGARESPGPLG